jgi:signal transduction histidine kinase
MSQDEAHRFDRLPPGFRNELPDGHRAERNRLESEVRAVSASPVVTAVLEVADAAMLVLNPERQVVGFNSRVPDVAAAEDVLGLRPGEALGCVNARGPGGCGSVAACETCGALGAILACERRNRPVEAECVIRTVRSPERTYEFDVRAAPVTVEDTRFTVVSFRDVSAEKRREALEQVFFHDVLNTVAGLRGWAERLQRAAADVPRATERIDFLARRVEREIQDHRALLLAESGTLVPQRAPLRTGPLVREVADIFSAHPVARDRRLELGPELDDVEVVSDRSLLQRVVVNMVRNAFEATPAGGAVGLSCARADGAVRLSVRNDGAMPPEVQARVFQRSFSTKAARGRGLGTYAMKLFGERYLGGAVSFVSTPDAGTVFTIRVPA